MSMRATHLHQLTAGAWPTAGGVAAAPGASDRIRPGEVTHSDLSDCNSDPTSPKTPIKSGSLGVIPTYWGLF